jgi:hypothetical protein
MLPVREPGHCPCPAACRLGVTVAAAASPPGGAAGPGARRRYVRARAGTGTQHRLTLPAALDLGGSMPKSRPSAAAPRAKQVRLFAGGQPRCRAASSTVPRR